MSLLFVIGSILFCSNPCHALPLFVEDFEGDLSAWTGKTGESHHGVIVADPLNSSNSVLTFTAVNVAGDIFTKESFGSGQAELRLSFDYLGLGPQSKSTYTFMADDRGAFVGWSDSFPGDRRWLAATSHYLGLEAMLPDTGRWEHVEFVFDLHRGGHLMLQDWLYSGSMAGDTFFDNILLETTASAAPVPEPSSLFLLSTGLIGLARFGRKQRKM